MSLVIENLPEAIRTTKRQLRAGLTEYKEVFREVEAYMPRRVEEIVTEREAGQDVIPIVQYPDVASGRVPAEVVGKVRSRGACVVRGTFSKEVTWTRSSRMPLRTSTLARWPRPNIKSTESIGHAPRSRHGSRSP
jgi:hypothetical protein